MFTAWALPHVSSISNIGSHILIPISSNYETLSHLHLLSQILIHSFERQKKKKEKDISS